MHKTALVPYSVSEMYALVADVESYPQFLPWCRSVTVHERDAGWVRVSLELAKGPVHQVFTTQNRLVNDKAIEVRLESGPFRKLEGDWFFEALGEHGSKVSLDLEFEFSSRLLAGAVGPVFNQLANTLVDAFVKRAHALYGKP